MHAKAVQPREAKMGSAQKPRRSIRAKLDRLVLVSVGLALVLAGAVNLWHESGRYLDAKRDTLLATAQAFGAATSKAVAARDRSAVAEGIRGISRVPGLVRAEVEDVDGALIADIGTAVRLSSDLDLNTVDGTSPFELLRTDTVRYFAPIVDSGRPVGRIVLISSTADVPERFRTTISGASAGALAALSLGLFLSHRLQRRITAPLVSLAAAMSEVERTNNYVPISGISSDDETGILASRFNAMINEVRRTTDENLAREDEIIRRLTHAAEQRDDQTGEHVVRVAKISRIIARQLGLEPRWTEELCRASPMHDVGKIAIPDAILFKPGRLDPEERRQMERHAEAGYRILAGSDSPLVQLAAEIAISHHERWDGQGYPNRVAGCAIPLSGRITAVADVCDALLSVRPYKQPWTFEAVRAHLIDNAGSHFDPACVDALIGCWTELQQVYGRAQGDPAVSAKAA
ncbi:HD domain-containing protein [Micromonospora sp. STR1s_5]|nr:HD domain-containing protein [Micromonospora sp. STR1s_5]